MDGYISAYIGADAYTHTYVCSVRALLLVLNVVGVCCLLFFLDICCSSARSFLLAATGLGQLLLQCGRNELFRLGMITLTQQSGLNVLALLYALYALQQIIIDALTDHRIFPAGRGGWICISLQSLKIGGGAGNSLVVRMLQHLFTYPGGCGYKLTSCTLLNEMQILLNGAVRIRVHLHRLQIASYKRHQTGEYIGLQERIKIF